MTFSFAFVILALSSFLKNSNAVAARADTCIWDEFPARGTLLRNLPHWKPRGCATNVFHAEEASSCLSGRNVYILGVSTARQLLFSIGSLVGGSTNVSRLEQKTSCPLSDECHQSVGGVDIRYRCFNFMDGFDYSSRGGFQHIINLEQLKNKSIINTPIDAFNAASKPSGWGDINKVCRHSEIRPFLSSFFNGSKTDDVLIFILGYRFAEHSDIVDFPSWLNASAITWPGHLNATFAGTVFRVTVSEAHDYGAHRNPDIIQVNRVLTELWSGREDTSKWHLIDQWTINKDKRELYEDFIHYPGVLTDASIQLILNTLCPHSGMKVDYPEEGLPTSDDMAYNILAVPNGDHYVADGGGIIHKLPHNSTCANTWSERGRNTLNISEHALSFLYQGSDFRSVLCQDSVLLRPKSQKTIYILRNKTLRGYCDGAQFMGEGHSFDSVTAISDFEYTLIFHRLNYTQVGCR